MRTFSAVTLPAHVRADLSAALPAGARYLPAERWHLTLAFYGEVSEDAATKLQVRLRRLGRRTAPIELLLAGGGAFRGVGAVTVWCGVAGEVPALRRLGEAATAAGVHLGLGAGAAGSGGVRPRPFRPHVTIARIRRPLPNNDSDDAGARVAGQSEILDALAGYRGPRWTVREFELYRSFLGPQPRYQRLATFSLEAKLGDPAPG
ncbi:MAG: RNA 2',3'-cyclic phosphodiesterase [Mycobacteriales bacterium]